MITKHLFSFFSFFFFEIFPNPISSMRVAPLPYIILLCRPLSSSESRANPVLSADIRSMSTSRPPSCNFACLYLLFAQCLRALFFKTCWSGQVLPYNRASQSGPLHSPSPILLHYSIWPSARSNKVQLKFRHLRLQDWSVLFPMADSSIAVDSRPFPLLWLRYRIIYLKSRTPRNRSSQVRLPEKLRRP